ncbi:hypothetical protein EBR21_09795, partial [bacterium]|nr:hypothetical protein [bacterium]
MGLLTPKIEKGYQGTQISNTFRNRSVPATYQFSLIHQSKQTDKARKVREMSFLSAAKNPYIIGGWIALTGIVQACAAAQSIATPSRFCIPKQDPEAAKLTLNGPGVLGIVGGQPASNTEAIERSSVALQVIYELADGSGNLAETCTAVVAAKNILITAAHCFSKPQQAISRTSIGVTSSVSLNNLKPSDVIGITAYKQHPEWNGQYHDIAVVQLKSDLPPDITPAKFVEDVSTLTKSTPVVLVGYGITRDNGKDSGTKRRTESMIDKVVNRENFPNTSIVNQIRVLDTSGNARGACFGDSGGPGYVKQSSQVFGVVQGINETVQPPENMNCSSGDANYTLIAPY